VRRHCPGDAASTPIPRIEIRQGPAKTRPLPAVYPTMVCFVLQGAKRVAFGGRSLVYRGESYMLLSADLPVTAQVIEATPRIWRSACCSIPPTSPASCSMRRRRRRRRAPGSASAD
jgi:hypothetical protein